MSGGQPRALIAGGGIGGLAAALACARAGTEVTLFERSAEFAEVGAGIQLGPNGVSVLHGWGMKDELAAVAAFPHRLQVRSAGTGSELGVLTLGPEIQARYGFPYATIHRADLHALLRAALTQTSVQLTVNSAVDRFVQLAHGVQLHLADGRQAEGDLLVGADGLWSGVRQQLLGDALPQPMGHLAYRALVSQSRLPANLRSQQVTAWLGPRLHVVQYPVRGGEWLNVVAFVHGQVAGNVQDWNHNGNAADLRRAMGATCSPLQALIHAIDDWRLWVLSIRPRCAASKSKPKVAWRCWAMQPTRWCLTWRKGRAWRLKTRLSWGGCWELRVRRFMFPRCSNSTPKPAGRAMPGCKHAPFATAGSFTPRAQCAGGATPP